jgi:N-acetylglucosamine-6-phosphate deacetylase
MTAVPDTTQPFAIRGQLAISGELHRGAIVVSDGLIDAVHFGDSPGNLPEQVIDTLIVTPGFIDLQVNGGFGVEVDSDPESFRVLSQRLPETGVTSYLPTIISSPADHYQPIFQAFEVVSAYSGARALGFHLEGPFLSMARKGAHDPEAISAAPDHLIEEWVRSGFVRLVTVASEREDGTNRIRKLVEAGIVVSLGHTDGTYDEFLSGVDAGATMATHLFNAMSPFNHREPGVIGAALVDDRVTVGLIADGIHSHIASLKLAFRTKGPERIALVSDMMAAAGMSPGIYPLGGREIATDGISARLPDGTLAGSLLTMDQGIRNLVEWGICSAAEAIQMSTESPANVLGCPQIGRLESGCDADLVLLDGALEPCLTFVRGRVAYNGREQ